MEKIKERSSYQKKRAFARRRMPASTGEKCMSVFAYTVMGLLSLIAILPCLHVISKAISSGPEVTAGDIYLAGGFPAGNGKICAYENGVSHGAEKLPDCYGLRYAD